MGQQKISEATIKKWKQSYVAADPIERVRNTYQISCEATDKKVRCGDAEVRRALLSIVNGDRSSAVRLGRVATMSSSLITEIIARMGEIQKEIDATRKTRNASTTSPTPLRTCGFSQTHLLVLTRARTREQQRKMSRESLRNGWTSRQLQLELQKSVPRDYPVRPLHLVRTANKQLDLLNALVASINQKSFADALCRTKLIHRTGMAKELDTAVETLAHMIPELTRMNTQLEKAKGSLKELMFPVASKKSGSSE